VSFPYIANLKCTPSDRQMYPWGTCTPGWEPMLLILSSVLLPMANLQLES